MHRDSSRCEDGAIPMYAKSAEETMAPAAHRRGTKGAVRVAVLIIALLAAACGEPQKLLSVVTGGTGGVYYPLGGGLANLLSTALPGYQVTSEVTGGSIDNLKLVAAGRADAGFSMVDAAWDAFNGRAKFEGSRLPIRTLVVLYPNRMHAVTIAGTGIESMGDLAGRRVSVGSPGSATEVMAVRVLEAYGLLDLLIRERLSVSESVNAMKDRKIDAFFWAGGLPTAAVTDLAATPGVQIKLLDHADAVRKMNQAHGPLYAEGTIGKDVYPGLQTGSRNATVWNILFVSDRMDEELAYQVAKAVFERRDALVAVHKEAEQISLANQTRRLSPIPFHPGAVRYLRERGVSPE
jgi:TRAP transporter TAXI family solute receptor